VSPSFSYHLADQAKKPTFVQSFGNRKHAVALLKERLGTMAFSQLIRTLLSSLLAVLEKKTEEAVHVMQAYTQH
jgi:hypothetical protein